MDPNTSNPFESDGQAKCIMSLSLSDIEVDDFL